MKLPIGFLLYNDRTAVIKQSKVVFRFRNSYVDYMDPLGWLPVPSSYNYQ